MWIYFVRDIAMKRSLGCLITLTGCLGLVLVSPAQAQRWLNRPDFFEQGREQFEREIQRLDQQQATDSSSLVTLVLHQNRLLVLGVSQPNATASAPTVTAFFDSLTFL